MAGCCHCLDSWPPAPLPLPVKSPPPSPDSGSNLFPEMIPVGEASRGGDHYILCAFSHLIPLNPYSQKCSKEGLRAEATAKVTQLVIEGMKVTGGGQISSPD